MADRTTPARDSAQAIAAALQRYRVMANVVGVLLILLFVVAVPLKHCGGIPQPVTVLGTAHGWLYFLFFLSAVDLALRAKWTLKGSVLTHRWPAPSRSSPSSPSAPPPARWPPASACDRRSPPP